MTTDALTPTEEVQDTGNLTRDALTAVQEVFADYVIFPSEEARDAVTLWVAHAHVFYAFESTPRLSISSREPGSGKSRVLEIIEHLVPNPLNAVNITPGVMWHAIEHTSPTLLFDEVDTVFGKNGSSGAYRVLRGIINAGHRKGACVPRLVGTNSDIKNFKVFSPIAMAGIGQLPETIQTRSVEIIMRKRKGEEVVRPFRLKFAQDALKRARTILEGWSMDVVDELEFAAPECPVQDRDADVWEPLLAIAELAGEEWAERARKACTELTQIRKPTKHMSPGVRLLTELRNLFGTKPVMATVDILAGLAQAEEPMRLTPRGLANTLREYNVSPTTVRNGDDVQKGYKADDLEFVWARYLSTRATESE